MIDEKFEAFFDRVASGDASVAAICREPGMPGLRTVYDRIDQDAEFAARFRARKAIGVRAIFDNCLEISDEPAPDLVAVQNKRVRIDTRLRLAGKWLAAEFGERVDVTSGGAPLGTDLAEAIAAARARVISDNDRTAIGTDALR